MKIPTKHYVKNIEWDQIPSGTMLRKFVATDDGGSEKDVRVVLHGFISDDGNVIITNELFSSDPNITGKKIASEGRDG